MSQIIHQAAELIATLVMSTGSRNVVDIIVDPSKCLAGRLWKPFHYIVFNPVYSLIILLVLYIIFLILYFPFYLASWIVGVWGSVGCLLYLFVWGCRAFARTMSFPGASKSLQRDFSVDFIKRTISQIDTFNTLASSFAIMVANSSKTRSRLNAGGDNKREIKSNPLIDHMPRKAAELAGWVDGMTALHTFLSDAIEDYRYVAYKQASADNGSGANRLGGGRRGSGSSNENGRSVNLSYGDTFTFKNFLSFSGWGKMTDKATDKLFGSMAFCTGETPIAKEEINEVLNPAIVVRDSFGSLLEHTGTLLRSLDGQLALAGVDNHESQKSRGPGVKGTPPRRERNLSMSSAGSPGSGVAELVASISMVIRYSDQLRNALGYMLVQSEHDDQKRKEMSAKLNRVGPVGAGIGAGEHSADAMEAGVGSLLQTEESSSGGSNSNFIASGLSKIAPNNALLDNLMNMNTGPRGPANLSFYIMRAHLVYQYQAYRFTVPGCDDNSIDCIYIPAGGRDKMSGGGDSGDSRNGKISSPGSDDASDSGSCSSSGESNGSVEFGEQNERSVGEQYYEHSNKETDDERAVLLEKTSCSPQSEYGTKGSAQDVKSGKGAKARDKKGRSSSLPPVSHPDSFSSPSADLTRSRSVSSGYGGSMARPAVSPVGTVLFCGPNAGMYESFSMANEEASWLSYYTRLGLDVVFFNYRGYNLSTGRPSPAAVQTDGIFVLEHMKESLGVRKVVLHGESIGGMVATHIARHFDCSLAHGSPGPTPSASFSNLPDAEEGVAMSGSASGSSPPNAFTIKALVCDRTFASLDAVAARFLGIWAAYGLTHLGPWHTDCVTPYIESDVGMKVIIQDCDDAIINHAASLKNAVATYTCTQEINWLPRTPASVDYRKAILNHETPRIIPDVVSEPFQLNHDFIEATCVSVISLAQRAQRAFDPFDGGADADLASSTSSRGGGNTGKSLSFRTFRPTYEWIRAYCSQSVEPRNTGLSCLEKILLVLLSMDSRTGSVLGEALGGGFDDLYPYFCGLVHWSPRSFGSSRTLGRSAAHSFKSFSRCIHRVCQDMETLVAQEQDMARDELVSFLRRALAFLRDKISESEAAARRVPRGDTSSAENSSGAPLFSPARGRGRGEKGQMLPAATAVKLSIVEDNHHHYGSNSANDSIADVGSVPAPGGPGGSGYVINVNCGHSGWPSPRALDSLTACLQEAGLTAAKSG